MSKAQAPPLMCARCAEHSSRLSRRHVNQRVPWPPIEASAKALLRAGALSSAPFNAGPEEPALGHAHILQPPSSWPYDTHGGVLFARSRGRRHWDVWSRGRGYQDVRLRLILWSIVMPTYRCWWMAHLGVGVPNPSTALDVILGSSDRSDRRSAAWCIGAKACPLLEMW